MMRERILAAYDPFVLPFVFGMTFVLAYCLIALVKILLQLSAADRRKFALSLVTPATIWKNIRDLFCDCLFHVKLWKRNKVLGYMHSSIAFGWFMIILIGHIETILYIPERLHKMYYPIFFRYFMEEQNTTLQGSFFFFLMDFFLLVILSGITIAIIKRFRSRIVGMRRTTRLTLLDHIGLYSLWAIFPLRWIAEGFTAGVAGGSFMTVPINWLLHNFMSKPENITVAWWLYSIALGTFLTVLPFTRYMHIPAEILLIPMRNAGLPVRHTRKGFSLAMLYSCPSCGVCIDACPMGVQKKNVQDATVYMVRNLKRRNARRSREIAEKCLMCGKCAALCQVQMDACGLRLAYRTSQENKTNQLPADFSYLEAVHPLPPAETVSGEKVLYYAGCMSSLTPVISRSVQKVLTHAGVDYELMDTEGSICCGRPLMLAGRKEEAEKLIAKNRQIIEHSGASILLVSCAICYRIFKEHYDLIGVEVVHYTEYFNKLLKEGRLKVRNEHQTIVYHDPCELGRGCGIYDAPREALRAAGQLVPAAKERVENICCGGSVGSLTLRYEDREPITRGALDNLTANNPEQIVTACPLCLKTFTRYAPVPVKDFAEVLADQLDFPTAGA
ncbi:MAG: (Fe-S)-binding protein [Bacteroidales bacterium]|nr:(Fe-S)-binding protein [Bacteroidales bacterium]